MKELRERGSAPLFVVMMAAAFGILIAYGLAKLTAAGGAMAQSAKFDGEIDRITREINGILADPKVCRGAFRDNTDAKVNADPAALPDVPRLYAGIIAGGRTVAKLDTSNTLTGLIITEMKLKSPYLILGNTWEMTLELKFDKILTLGATAAQNTLFPGASSVLRRFRMSVTIDPANNNHIIQCSPLGSRAALGPMSPIRATIDVTPAGTCAIDADKNTLCQALTPPALGGLPANPQTYFPANQGEALFYGILISNVAGPAPSAPAPGLGIKGVALPLYARGGQSTWSLVDKASADASCQALCINKDAPIRFSTTLTSSTAAISGNTVPISKDAVCKQDFGTVLPTGEIVVRYVAATFNDFAQAGWTSTDGGGLEASVPTYSATIGGHDGEIQFGVGDFTGGLKGVRLMNFTNNNINLPVACVRLR